MRAGFVRNTQKLEFSSEGGVCLEPNSWSFRVRAEYVGFWVMMEYVPNPKAGVFVIEE